MPLLTVESWGKFIMFSETAEPLGSMLDCKWGQQLLVLVLLLSGFSVTVAPCFDVFLMFLCGEVNSVSTDLATLISFHQVRFVVFLYCQQTTWKRNWKKKILFTVLSKAIKYFSQFSSVQTLSSVWLFATPWTVACPASLSITISQSLSKLMSIESVMPSNHLILCRSLLLLPSIFLSIRVFSNESVLHIRWPRYWSFSFNISPSNEHPGLISFRMDWCWSWNSNTLATWCEEPTH